MPLLEYLCAQCGKRFTVLVGMTSETDSSGCPYCGASQATRRISRFARLRGDDEVIDGVTNPDAIGDPQDPRTMRRWADDMGAVMGEGLGDEFEEYLDAAEADE